MVPGKQEGNAACEVPDTKERKCFQGEGLPPFRTLPITIYLASFMGLAIRQRFHMHHPTQLSPHLGWVRPRPFQGQHPHPPVSGSTGS